ncbi:MAG: hypothetical protein HY568_01730 [Candidatus Latescibacteria bacterium]|nr:hypothetical protein [Candidatus Latescibacterota bacterium]
MNRRGIHGIRGAPAAALAAALVVALVAIPLCLAGTARSAASPREEIATMLERVLRAPGVVSRVSITRSDPFGGPPERSNGRLWFLPGRGLRYHTDERGGEDIVLDRERQSFTVYRRAEKVLYRAPWDRAPARLRQLVAEPERILEKDLHASPEARVLGGVSRAGYRLRRAALGDSLPAISVWLAADPSSGLPRWVGATSEEDSVLVEFKGLTTLSSADAGHLALRIPKGVRTEPFDPRELLRGGESR